MENKEERLVPKDGDFVRQRGSTNGPVMLVVSEALGEDHLYEGVRNGVYCTWTVDDEECFEVYNARDLVIVERDGT